MNPLPILLPQPTESVLSKRNRCDYSLKEQHIMKLKKQNVLNDIEVLNLTGKSIIFESQEIIAYRVVTAFKDRRIINIMVVSKTQSGKTGSMLATIKQFLEDSSNLIPIENIYIITGLSSCEWKEQTKERMPETIQARVFHRCELPVTFVEEIVNKRNLLIIMDEIQVAAKKGQTIYNTFKHAGLLDKAKLHEKDVKILEYTATPDGTIYDLMKWGDASSKILADVGEGYVSSYNLLEMGRLRQFKELCGYNVDTGQVNAEVFTNIQEIKHDVDTYASPMYHIIRTKNGVYQDITVLNFQQVFDAENFEFIKYDRESEIQDINKTLRLTPLKHTFIFIKEMLRCAKTLVKTFLGVQYERYTPNSDDASINQSLVGRLSGYDDNGLSICYTNLESVEKYETLWNSNFDDTTVQWNSKTTKFVNGTLSATNTFNGPKNYTGISLETTEDEIVEPREPVIKKFKTQEDSKEYYHQELKKDSKGRGPNRVKPNAEGYYEATIRSKKGVYSCEELRSERRQGLTDTNYRCNPCYENKEDKTTLQWWVIHY